MEDDERKGGVPSAKSKLGRYALRYCIGRGGMASVYLAQLNAGDEFRKWVAIKTIHPHIAENKKYVRMFLNEAKLAARIDHPNVCSVFDFGEVDGSYYLAMEYLHGESLGSLLRRAVANGHLPFTLAARIVADAARGLHVAHELRDDAGRPVGVIHRDVSPQNVFVLYSGVTKVVDFGVARSGDSTERTATGELRGKMAYMSPEQLRCEKMDRRVDVWALGVVLWEASTGRRLFKRTGETATMLAVLQDPVTLPSTLRDGYPPALEAIVMRALDRDLDKRYPTALALARDLEAFMASTGESSGADVAGEQMSRLFAKEIAAREQLLRGGPDAPVDVASAFPDASAGDDDTDGAQISIGPGTEVSLPAVLHSQPARAAAPATSSDEPRRSRTSMVVALAMIIAVATIGIGFVGWRARADRTAASPPAPQHATTPSSASAPVTHASAAPQPAITAQDPPAAHANDAPPAPASAPSVIAAAPHDNAVPGHAPHTLPTRNARSAARVDGPVAAPAEPAGPSGDTTPGRLTLSTVPPSEVYEGSRHLGTTPLEELPLSAGTHHLRVRPTDDAVNHDVNVRIEPGATSVVRLRFE